MAKKREIIITCDAKRVEDTFKFLDNALSDIKKKMQALNEQGEKEGWTEQMKKEFEELKKTATSINNFELGPAEKSVRKFEEVLKNLAGSTLKDVKRALNEGKSDLNKLAENDPKRAQLNEELAKLARQIEIIGGKSQSLTEAKKQLSELANTPTEKLRQGLAAINKELETNARLSEDDRNELKGYARQYEAEIAVKQHGKAGTAPIASMNAEQLRAEQQRLRAGYMATEGAAGYESVSQDYLARLQAVNQAVKELTETERNEEQQRRKTAEAAEALAKADDVSTRLYYQEKVSLQELIETQRTYEAELKKLQGVNLTPQEQQTADELKTKLEGVKQAMQDIAQIDIDKTFDAIENGTANLEQMEDALKKLKEQATKKESDDVFGIKENLQDIEAMQKAIDEMKAKLQGIDDIDFDNLDDIPIDKLEAKLKQLEEQEKKLAVSDKQASEQMAANKRKVQEAIQKVKNNTIDLQNAQNVAANTGKHNVQQLQTAYDTLKQHLMSLNTNQTGEIKKTRRQMEDLKKKIDEVTGAVKKQGNAFATTAKNLATYMIGFAGFNKIKSLIEGVFQSNLKLSDSLANIRKVSGLSGEAINQLYRNLSQIDTRNTIEMLNQLAYTGAKLGIGQNYGVEGLTGFVKAAEQVQMALGEDMGEKALPELSKMVEVMGLIPKYGVEQSMQKAASAIFQLGATSTATGSNIVEFSKRLMGLANVSRISTQDLLALGSASDAMGLMPEVSATAFNKLFTSIQRQHNLIEDSLGLTKGTIKSLYDEGKTMDAIVMIFEKMNEKGNLNLLGSIFKDLGSDGARLVNVMATMADRADMLRKHLETSREAFKEGEAVIGEYMIQNQTAAAFVERASNLWAKAFTNPEGVDVVKEMARAWYDLSKQMTQSDALMWSLHTSISAIASAIGTLIKLFPVLIRFAMVFGSAFGLRAAISGVGGLITAFRTLYTDIKLATGAWGTLNVVMKSNAFLFAASAIITAISLVNDYKKSADEAAKREAERQARLQAAFENSKEAVEKVVKPLEIYKRALDDASLSEKQRMQLVKQFKNDYQDYLDYLGIEIESAVDLAKAYAQVVKVMKQKKAYEERESYRQQENGENRMNRITAQMELIQEAKKMGVTIDKQWLESNYENGSTELYKLITSQYQGPYDENHGWEKVAGGGYVAPGLNEATKNYFNSRNLETDIDARINKMFNTEYKDIDLENFDIDEFNDRVQRARWKRQGSLENEAPDKDALKAAKKAQQEAKEAMRKEMQDAQKESTGVLSKLEEWYRLQEAAITEARADGKMTAEQAAQMVNALSIIKNESLATARRAITTGDTSAWDELKTKVMPKAMTDASDLSKSLLETIQNVPIQALHDNLAKFNGDAEKVFGLDSRAFFDQINAKAAGNTREAARLRAKMFKQAEKLLEQYEVVRVAQKKMQTDLEGIGIVTETYEEFAQRMQQGITDKQPKTLANGKTITDEEAYAQMGAKFIGQGTIPYRINIENADEALQWIQDFATNAQGELEDWAQAFPDIERWVELLQRKVELQAKGKLMTEEEVAELAQIPETLAEAIPTIRAMFYQLEQSANNVADAIKRQVEAMNSRKPIGINEMREQHEGQMNKARSLWQEQIDRANASDAPKNDEGDTAAAVDLKKQRDQQLIDMEYQYQQELWSIREQMGVTWQDQYENELAGYKNMLDKKLISEQQFQKKKGQLQAKLGLQYAEYFNGQLKELVDTMREYEITSTENKYDAQINAARVAGQDTTALEEQKEAAILDIRKKYAAMDLAIKISEIGVNTALGIMNAYATLPTPAAIAATVLIAALGAAQTAIAIAEYEKVMGQSAGTTKSSSTAATKTKAVSGMLTYDKGNVQRFIGQDGKVYTATEEPAPRDGLVTHPIATTVQGQPALVAENGPEIVVGRETTRAIMMNEPELIRYLANYQRQGGRYLPYDSGNVDSVQSAGVLASDPAAAEREALRQRLDKSDALMAQVLYFLQNPVAPEIAMYDSGGKKGLHTKMKEANRFMARYGG